MGKRKYFTGNRPVGQRGQIKSRKVARKITSEYHNRRNSLALVKAQLGNESDKKVCKMLKQQIHDIEALIDASGGTDIYQKASILSTQHFSTSKWVISTLGSIGANRRMYGSPSQSHTKKKEEKKKRKKKSSSRRLSVLEVGAINTQLQQCPWLDVSAIDVNSQHSSIQEIDFFDYPLPVLFQRGLKDENCDHLRSAGHVSDGSDEEGSEYATNRGFEVLVSSMVVNCVDSPKKRLEMLARFVLQLNAPSSSSLDQHGECEGKTESTSSVILNQKLDGSNSQNTEHGGGDGVSDDRYHFLKNGGLLFLVLPRRCIDSFGKEVFEALLSALGLVSLANWERTTPKLYFYVLQRSLVCEESVLERRQQQQPLRMKQDKSKNKGKIVEGDSDADRVARLLDSARATMQAQGLLTNFIAKPKIKSRKTALDPFDLAFD
jgi:hypothetical protein